MVTLDQAGRGRRGQVIRAPTPALAEFVEHLWLAGPSAGDPRAGAWRIVPDHAPHLIGYTCALGSPRLVLVGSRTVFTDIDVSARPRTVGVRLRAGAVPALFGIPANELTDRSVPVEEVLGCRARHAAERLAQAADGSTFEALCGLIQEILARARPLDPRARALFTATGSAPVSVAGASERTRRLLAQHHFGMGSKRLQRIRRLHRALELGLGDRPATWARIAAIAGYADQAHLIRDFNALLGETPAAFVARAKP